MKKYLLILPLIVANLTQALAFCGFYVAKADAKLFNKSSQVIIVRDGTQTAITMSSDFDGDVKDFAMVVPVPEVIKKKQIRVAEQAIFDKLDTYSGPRLVEYHDSNPCMPQPIMVRSKSSGREMLMMSAAPVEESERDYGVTIVESYTVGEYDILILSAKESDGLELWLKKNGYKIPESAADVLEPYIKSDMKFFVVKVNLEEFKVSGSETLRPIQMTFTSDRFMLPIRLGMANANGDQDMIVYSFSKKGRIETTNYRTEEIPTNAKIPLGVKDQFGEFYKSVFDNSWKDAGKSSVMLEYAWDLSSSNFVKCDPCPTQPPAYTDLREAGVFWVKAGGNGAWGGSDYEGDVFMTRLHVRYNRKTFPQDLTFQATPNKENFQGRYILTHPAKGKLSCGEGQDYLLKLHSRRQEEVDNLEKLAGWDVAQYEAYVSEYDRLLNKKHQPYLDKLPDNKNDKNALPVSGPNWPSGPWFYWLLGAGLLFLAGLKVMKNRVVVHP